MWLQAWIFENVIEFDADWNQIYLPSTASMLPNLTIQLKKFIIKLTKVAKYERSGATSCYMAIGEKSAVVTQTRRKAYWLRVTQFPLAMFHRCSLKAGTNFTKWLWIRLWLRDGAAFKMMGENIGTIFNTFSEKYQQITVWWWWKSPIYLPHSSCCKHRIFYANGCVTNCNMPWKESTLRQAVEQMNI